MKKHFLLVLAPILGACTSNMTPAPDFAEHHEFRNVSVHDPSIMEASDGTYYITGSHMAGARTSDFIDWTQISTSVNDQHWFKDIRSELGGVMSWGKTNTFWAGCFIQLKDGPYAGKYMMNYCVCQGNCPQGAIGYAISDSPEGPYTDKGVLLWSFGTNNTEDLYSPEEYESLRTAGLDKYAHVTAPDGTEVDYNANYYPNAIDPCTFYDKDGQLWMLYGSYSGGIFILKLNPDGTIDRNYSKDYYGTKLMGSYHTPIEGPFMMYSPETDYYYIFTSYGGLNANGGYNIRVARCKTPDGVFEDPAGNPQTECMGKPGQSMGRQNPLIEKYGLKLMGNFEFEPSGDSEKASEAYMSPGHNSAFYDIATGKYYLIFHTRFKGTGESHQVRVHQMFMNEDGWPVTAPHRYAGDISGVKLSKKSIAGAYKFINHGTRTTADITESVIVNLNSDGTISGPVKGTWEYRKSGKNNYATFQVDGKTYKGVFHYQCDPANNVNRITFSACGSSNETIWGSKADV